MFDILTKRDLQDPPGSCHNQIDWLSGRACTQSMGGSTASRGPGGPVLQMSCSINKQQTTTNNKQQIVFIF